MHKPASNGVVKFREAFEKLDTSRRWRIVKQSPGDLILLEGNTVAASYLDISICPLCAGSETTIETIPVFNFPFRLGMGLHLSQRVIGANFSAEVVDTEELLPTVPQVAISSIQQATTTLTVTTATAHNLRPGMCIGIYGVNDSRLNYSELVVASIPTITQFTATAGPAGTIPSVTAGPFTTGFVYIRSRLGNAQNGLGMMFEGTSATTASTYVRSDSGDALPSGTVLGSHLATIASTASIAAVNAAYVAAWTPTSLIELLGQLESYTWMDKGIDTATSAYTSRHRREQILPDQEKDYKLRFRAVTHPGNTIPVGQIVTISKAGSTTATVVTDVPHGLTTADVICIYGVADQTNFANLTTATAVASIVDAKTFTVILGSSVTATSRGGYVSRVNGGNLPSAIGAVAQTVQSISRTNNVVTVIGSGTWATVAQGDLCQLVGVRTTANGSSLELDGAYRVESLATTTMILTPLTDDIKGVDIVSTPAGGGVIKRTSLRLSFVRIMEFTRQIVELYSAAARGETSNAAPVTIIGTVPVSGSISLTGTTNSVQGNAAHDAAVSGSPVRAAGRARTSNVAAVSNDDTADLITTLVGAQVQKPYSIPEADFIFAAPQAGIVNTATALQIKEAPAAGLRNYYTGISVYSETLTTATELELREPDLTCNSQTISANTLTTSANHNLAIGDQVVFTALTGITGAVVNTTYYVLTVPSGTTLTLSATRGGSTLAISGTITATLHRYLWKSKCPTTGIPLTVINFTTPLKGAAAVAQTLQTVTASGAGAVYVNGQGYIAP